jgi:hypothetical protein
MPPSGPNATLAGTVKPPKLPLVSVKVRLLSGVSASVKDDFDPDWAKEAGSKFARQSTRPLILLCQS